ncbi:hypothetical protein C8J57DRAFT_1528402 [Mycena rebaudengoi]|nr:hypothetical protein C8J57DRAFT_1528402 [Mycena rebaudengoi]
MSISKHSVADNALIESRPGRDLIEFRNSVYHEPYIRAHAALFLDNEWIKISDLQLFLDARNTVPACLLQLEPSYVKEENIDFYVKLEPPPPCVPPPDIQMRTLLHGNHEILELLSSDSEGDDLACGPLLRMAVQAHSPSPGSPQSPPPDTKLRNCAAELCTNAGYCWVIPAPHLQDNAGEMQKKKSLAVSGYVSTRQGSKKDFVDDNISAKLIDEFQLDSVYNLDTVRKKIARYFYNKGLVKTTGETVKVKKTVSKPVNKSAIDIFRVEEEAKIAVKATQLMNATPEALKNPGLNLALWKTARDDLFRNLDEKTRATYQTIADEHNEQLKDGPAHEEIYRNQSAIVPNIARALQSSIGYGWGGHGDVGLFVAGVYRDNLNVLRTFSLSTQAQAGAAKFSDHISDLMPDLRTALKSWGEEVLPSKCASMALWWRY